MTVHYKMNGFSDELALLMDKELRSKTAEANTGTSKLEDGLNCLEKAASILEHLQEREASEAVTLIIEKMAGK